MFHFQVKQSAKASWTTNVVAFSSQSFAGNTSAQSLYVSISGHRSFVPRSRSRQVKLPLLRMGRDLADSTWLQYKDVLKVGDSS